MTTHRIIATFALAMALLVLPGAVLADECRVVNFDGQWVAAIDPAPVPGTEPIGIRFSAANGWFTLTSPPAIFSNNPSGTGVGIWTAGSDGEISFDSPVSRVSFFFASGYHDQWNQKSR